MRTGGRAAWLASAALLLAAVLVVDAVRLATVATPGERLRDSRLNDAMSSVESQIELQLNKLAPAPSVVPNPLSGSVSQPRFKATAQETVSALNTLDLKMLSSNASSASLGPSQAYPRNVVAAFGSIAAETVQRAHYAVLMLRNQRQTVERNLKGQREDLSNWVAAQTKVAEQKIQQQEAVVGRLEDEVSHLQKVYQDAMAKERSYQVQANMIISERQLQRTPPVMPVEVATALSDSQFQESIQRLSRWRKAAQQVMQQAATQIAQRKKAIEQGTTWVQHSKKTLSDWVALQNDLIQKFVARLEQALADNKARMDAVVQMSSEATTLFQSYSNTIARLDIKKRIEDLEAALKQWKAVNSSSPYDDVQIKSHIASMELEIKATQTRLDAVKGNDSVPAPPPSWGLLSGFPSGPKVVFPEPVSIGPNPTPLPMLNQYYLHPFGHPHEVPRPTDPLVRATVPTREDHDDLFTPLLQVASPGLPTDMNPFPGLGILPLSSNTGSASASSASKSSLLETAASTTKATAGASPAPVLPNLPPPPEADMLPPL